MIEPVQEAITGNESHSDVCSPQYALTEFYRALNTRDMTSMEANWGNTEDVAMDNPLGGIKRGWPEIRSVYERLFRFQGQYRFEFYDYTLHQAGTFFYVVGRERGEIFNQVASLEMKIRTTRLFQLHGERWRQIHHHGSIDDPQLLAAYQTFILR